MGLTGTSPWRVLPPGARVLLAVTPLLGLAAVLVLAQVHLDAYLWGTGEDGLVEWATVLCYLVAAALAVVLTARWWRARRRLAAGSYALLGAGFVFITGEEISWGQRLLGFQGPAVLVENNLQHEANLHNLLDRYALHGLYVVIALWGVGVGRWVVRRVGWLRPGWAFAPSRELMWWFLPVLAYYVYVDYLMPVLNALPLGMTFGEGPNRLQEPVELALAAGFLLFVVEVWLRSSAAGRPRDGSGAVTVRRGAARPS